MSQQGQRFRRRALRRGYKVDEVDDFLDRVEATMTGRPLGEPVRARDVHDFVFRVRFGGYDEWQVDMHLDRVERELTALEENGALPTPAPPPLTAGNDSFALPPADPHLGLGPRDEPMRAPDEPTMVRPARAAASVPQPDPAMPAAGSAQVRPSPSPHPMPGPVSPASPPAAGRAAPGPHAEPPPSDFTQKLPPVAAGYEPTEYPSRRESSPRYEPDPSRYEPDQQRYEAPGGRYDPEPRRYAPEPPRFEPQRGYAPEPPAFEAEPRRYAPEPPRFQPGPAAGGPGPAAPDPHGRSESTGYGAGARYETGFEPGRHGKVDMTTEIPAADSPFTPEDLHQVDLARRTFQARRFGSGYDPSQVNRLFDAIVATMSGRSTVQVSDGELDPAQFSLVTGGYYESEVDGALRDVREIFARRGIGLSR